MPDHTIPETDAVEARRLVVLTGMSGAGKQLTSQYFEDMHWRVVDNLPPRLLSALVTGTQENAEPPPPLCVVCDARSGDDLNELLPALDALSRNPPPGVSLRLVLLFLDASDEELVKRFKETRRTHPLYTVGDGILPAIRAERALLGDIKAHADRLIDTTGLTPLDLRTEIYGLFGNSQQQQHPLTVTVTSFGFKHGIPMDADLVFDVRFLRNPHYVDDLRPFDGRDEAVEKYVMEDERASCFLDRLYDLVGWSLPQYITEGKAYLTVAIGCTGGKHRSVLMAEKLAAFLRERGYPVRIQHRDVERDRGRR